MPATNVLSWILCHASTKSVIFVTGKPKWQLLVNLSGVWRGVCWGMCDYCYATRSIRRGENLLAIASLWLPRSTGLLSLILSSSSPLLSLSLLSSESHQMDFSYCNTSALNTPTTTICWLFPEKKHVDKNRASSTYSLKHKNKVSDCRDTLIARWRCFSDVLACISHLILMEEWACSLAADD